jgi:MYXO-CTERM domain-containing protein
MDVVEDWLYLFGGQTPNGVWRNDLWAFDLNRRVWRQVEGDCEPGDDCPPPARGSSLIQANTPGAVTLALGTPATDWDRTEHEWRYVRSLSRWYPEDSYRGDWGELQPPPPPPQWCSFAAPGSQPSVPWAPLLVLGALAGVILVRRRRRP